MIDEDRPAARQFQAILDDLPGSISDEVNRFGVAMEVMGHAYAHALNEAFRRKLFGPDPAGEAERRGTAVERFHARVAHMIDPVGWKPETAPPSRPSLGVSGCATAVVLSKNRGDL